MIEELNQAIALPARSGSKGKALLHMIPYDHERRRTAQSVQQRIISFNAPLILFQSSLGVKRASSYICRKVVIQFAVGLYTKEPSVKKT